ncbi:MAG: zf-HC2 domain-containing protein [Acidobacteriota bacterium]
MTRDSHKCGWSSEALVLYLYGDLSASDRERMGSHLSACARCHRELDSFRETLELVDAADLRDMATFRAPGDIGELRRDLDRLKPASRGVAAYRLRAFARAAAVLLLAGVSFLAGRHWEQLVTTYTLLTEGTPQRPDTVPGELHDAPGDLLDGNGLLAFSKQTNGYFDRSRLVLLEFANANAATSSPALRAASQILLGETDRVRQLAHRLNDKRIERLVSALEQILRQIAALSGQGDATAIAHIKRQIDDILDQLEILRAAPQRLAVRRS